MRGKVTFASALHKGHRITPAYAGKSSRPLRPPECRKDHPRVCGEKELRQAIAVQHIGSPPRMRGKESIAVGIGDGIGITPAYAGKSTSALLFLSCSWDHPRVCGEKVVWSAPLYEQMGSPPRMRGKALSGSLSSL